MENNETIKLKNAMNFYMLANNLKYITDDGFQSIADKVYGAMILATAINSEYVCGSSVIPAFSKTSLL